MKGPSDSGKRVGTAWSLEPGRGMPGGLWREATTPHVSPRSHRNPCLRYTTQKYSAPGLSGEKPWTHRHWMEMEDSASGD